MDLAVIVGENIRRTRVRQKVSQEKLAELAGLNKTHMWRIENGRLSIRLDTLSRIAAALSTRMTALLRGCHPT